MRCAADRCSGLAVDDMQLAVAADQREQSRDKKSHVSTFYRLAGGGTMQALQPGRGGAQIDAHQPCAVEQDDVG